MEKTKTKTIFQKILSASRFFIVAGLAIAVLSNPFSTEAGKKTSSSASILNAHSSIAGLTTQIETQGKTFSQMEILIQSPDSGKELILQSTSDEQGIAKFLVDGFHLNKAGTYKVMAKHAGISEPYSSPINFEVYSGTLSALNSEISLSKKSALSGETVEVKVKLKDEMQNPLKGHMVKLESNQERLEIYSKEFATNQNGEINFYVNTQGFSKDTLIEFSAIDLSSNTVLASTPNLAVIASKNSNIFNQGGSGSVILSSESGPLNYFSIELLNSSSSSIQAGKNFSLNVSARDADGNVVTDYTGTIRFSSSDTKSTMPNDYTFLAEDAGSHNFNLAFTMLSPGSQTITVNDTSKFTIEGIFNLNVTTNSENTYTDDFVSSDFERDGDFSLISPASGSYSSNSINVQGAGEYGKHAIIYLDDEEVGRVEIDFENSFSYTISNLDDGTYVLYADIVTLGEGEIGEEEILSVDENSASETVVIDTRPPDLLSITASPNRNLEPEQEITITVLSESGLEEASILLNNEIYDLESTTTSGKYVISLNLPASAGQYGFDVILTDALGNTVQYRDELILEVNDLGLSMPEVEDETSIDFSEFKIQGLTSASGEEAVYLSWEWETSDLNFNPDASFNYKVYYGPSENALFASQETSDSVPNLLISGLPGGETYYFAVSIVDSEGNESAKSDVITGFALAKTTQSNEIPQTPEPILITELPEETPETGASTTIFIIISIFGAIMFTRKNLSAKVF